MKTNPLTSGLLSFLRPREKTPAVAVPERLDMELDGVRTPVFIRRNAKARRLTLRVRAASRDVVLTAPPHVSIASIKEFAIRHREWVRVRLGRLPESVPFEAEAIIPFRGVPHRIVHEPSARGTVWLGAGEEKTLHVAGEAPHLPRRVGDFLKREARHDLTAAVEKYAAVLGVQVNRITLRDTTSRWGSCSAKGDLSFSWRLILAPPGVLDYLAAHEVAHRLEMNHSPRFWKAVDRVFPEREKAETWLRIHGASLHRYGG
ncbi:M48 family metallopeptidase [Xanthobacter sp. TB0136]|uniref:M48 family metallopeptidase n=1 Tax=Xanthobacter sp. TB0136 TaxID=3459177 RepID=UPI004039B15B